MRWLQSRLEGAAGAGPRRPHARGAGIYAIEDGLWLVNGESTVVTFGRPGKLVIDTTGGVPSHWVWRRSGVPDANSTRVDLELDYAVPKALVFMGRLLEKQNEKSATTQLANLNRLAEEV